MTFLRWSGLPALGAGLLALACGGDGGGGTGPCTPGLATQLLQGGDQQQWYFNNPLPASYSVTARDASNCPVPGIVVNWAVASGGGSVNPAQSTTNASGVASALHTLGGSTMQSVTATPTAAPGLQAVTFTAFAVAPPTTAAVEVQTTGANSGAFSPQGTVVQVDGMVTWTWSPGGIAHNVTYVTEDVLAGRVNSPTQASGTHTNTITTVGRFAYSCTVHSGMNGTVTVVN